MVSENSDIAWIQLKRPEEGRQRQQQTGRTYQTFVLHPEPEGVMNAPEQIS